jgi:epsin
MLDSIVKAATELKDKVGTRTEVQKILNEATNSDNWNIANSKLQVLADHSYDWNDYNIIMKHLWGKLSLKPKAWRNIFKALTAMDFLLK